MRVVGHVSDASPRKGDSVSKLGLVFDKIVSKNGTDVPLKASIQAIGMPVSNASAWPDERWTTDAMRAEKPALRDPGQGPGYDAKQRGSSAQLPPNVHGAIGMSGVSLSEGTAGDSLLTSTKRNVKLDSGMQMILRIVQ